MHTLSLKEISFLFKSGKKSAEEITTYFINRIKERDGQVNAFVFLNEENALAQARLLDKQKKNGEVLGKLAGVPIAIKDNIHIQGIKTTCASRMLESYTPPFSASVIELLAKEGVIFLGKTNLDEFAMGSSTEKSIFSSTSNPWNLENVAGGSSGGSAAAVAARFCPVSLGSDTGGSIRQPAAFCGVIGLKPSYGRVSRKGLVAFASSLDQIGPFGTCVEDICAIMEVIGQYDSKDSTSAKIQSENYLESLKTPLAPGIIGVSSELLSELDAEIKENFFNALEVLKAKGWKTKEIKLEILKHAIAVYYTFCSAEASTNLARFDGVRYGHRSSSEMSLEEMYKKTRKEGLGLEVKQRILLGTYVLSSEKKDFYYKKACLIRKHLIKQFAEAFQNCQYIAFPVTSTTSFPKNSIRDPLALYLQDLYTVGANLAYLPAISVFSGLASNSLPLGIQFIGPRFSDLGLCRLAYFYESSSNYDRKIPEKFL